METGITQQTIAVFGEALVDDFIAGQVVGGAPFSVARIACWRGGVLPSQAGAVV